MSTPWSKNIDLSVAAQLKNYFFSGTRLEYPFITLSREYGCDGVRLANLITETLNKTSGDQGWFVLDREHLLEASDDQALTEETMQRLEEFGHSELQGYIREAIFGMGNQVETVRKIAKIQRLFADRGRVVLLGGAAPIVTKDMARGIHVYLHAPLEWRIQNYAKRWQVEESEARSKVVHKHSEREAYVKTYLGADIGDLSYYHMSFNNAMVSVDIVAETIAALLKSKALL